MEHEFESTPRVTTRRTIVFHPIKISGLSVEATLRWLRNVCRWRTPVRAAVFVALHRLAAVSSKPPYQGGRRWNAVPTDVATGPAAHNRRYVKELRSLCEGTAILYIIAPMGAMGFY